MIARSVEAPAVRDEDRLWTVADVGRFLGLHPRSVYRLHGIPRLRIGGSVRFLPSEVRKWAGAQKVGD